jgi:hypothetical protein
LTSTEIAQYYLRLWEDNPLAEEDKEVIREGVKAIDNLLDQVFAEDEQLLRLKEMMGCILENSP